MTTLPEDITASPPNYPAGAHADHHNELHTFYNDPTTRLNGTFVALLGAATGVAATDTATVQAALTAVPSTGGLIVGTPGAVYLLNATVFIKSNTVLRDVTLKRADNVLTATVASAANNGQTALLACGPSTSTMYASGTQGSNIRLENVTLDGNKAGQGSLPGGITSSNFFAHNFAAKHVDDVTLDNVVSKNSVMSGIYAFNSKRVKISGGKSDSCGDSRLAADINKNGVSLTGTSGDGGEAYLVHGTHVTGAIDEGIMYGFAKDVTISDCHIYSSGKKGIEGDSASVGAGPGNIIVSGNYIRTSGEEGIGISNADSQKVVITGNQIYDSALSGIAFDQDTESTAVISDNIIEDFAGGYAAALAAHHGVTVTGHKITVTRNQIRDGAGSGVAILAGRLVTVAGNTIENVKASGVIYPGAATPDLEAFNVHDNTISTSDSHGIRVTTTSAVVKKVSICGNVLNDTGLTGAGASPSGIRLDGTGTAIKRVTVSDNLVTDERVSPEMGFALEFINLTNAITFAKVTDNILHPGQFRGFEGRAKCAKLVAHGNVTSSNGGAFRNPFGTAAPVAGDGAFLLGDFAYNSEPVAGGPLGWTCTVAGTPGTWVPVYVGDLFAIKPGDETVTSSTVLQDDDHLTVPVAANATYVVEAFLVIDGATAGDFKLGFTAPASATFDWSSLSQGTGTSSSAGSVSTQHRVTADNISAGVLAGTKLVIRPMGVLITAGTAGSFTVQWAQNASDLTATTLYARSFLRLRRVA